MTSKDTILLLFPQSGNFHSDPLLVPFVGTADSKISQDGPIFKKHGLLARLRNKMQPYITRIKDVFTPEKDYNSSTMEQQEIAFDEIMNTLLVFFGTCKNVDSSPSTAFPRGPFDEISGLLTELNVVQNVGGVCSLLSVEAKKRNMEFNEACEFACELLNHFATVSEY